MFRFLLVLLVMVILPSLIRAVMAILGKAVQNSESSAPIPTHAQKPDIAKVGELKKDPICGTFISTTTAFQKAVQGETYYFCSTQCRDQFQG
jgi:YHS domain-containing protein